MGKSIIQQEYDHMVKGVKRILFLHVAVQLFLEKLRDETRAARKRVEAQFKGGKRK